MEASEYVFILEGHQIPGREERREAKEQRWYKELNTFWMEKEMSYVQNIGHTMTLLKQSGAPTHREWVEYYLGRQGGTERLLERIRVWSELSGLDMMKASIFHIVKVFDDTWAGRERELVALEQMKAVGKEGMEYRLASEEEDLYGIDIIVECTQTGDILGGVQVKPLSFFQPPRFSSWEKVMQRGMTHMMHFRENLGVPCFYLIPEENQIGAPLKYRKIEDTPLRNEEWKKKHIRDEWGFWVLAK